MTTTHREACPCCGHLTEAMAEELPWLVHADVADDGIVVESSEGVLRLRYAALALRFDSGQPLAIVALQEAARQYWDEFSTRGRR